MGSNVNQVAPDHAMLRPHDLTGILYLFTAEQGGRQQAVLSGYRPLHKLYDNYFSSGKHEYPENGSANPGEVTVARVWLITPEVYPASIWVGRQLEILESPCKVVGTLTVQEIINPILRGNAEGYSPLWVAPPCFR